MSAKQRLALVAVGVSVLVVAAIALVDEGRQEAPLDPGVTSATGPSGTDVSSGGLDGSGGGASGPNGGKRAPDPGPLLQTGEVTELEVAKGEVARFRARSETTDELHVHGYDIERELPAGETVKVRFTADLDGVYEIELHGSGEQIGELTVNP